MDYQITLLQDGTTFQANESETLLQAAIKSGVRLPYSCNDGRCLGCLQPVVSGDLYHQDLNVFYRLGSNQAVLCRAYAKTDITLDCGGLPVL